MAGAAADIGRTQGEKRTLPAGLVEDYAKFSAPARGTRSASTNFPQLKSARWKFRG